MLTALRAAWARLSFAGLRAALSRLWEATPLAARRPAEGALHEGLRRIEGPVSADPMSGALMRAGRRLAPPPAAAGGEPLPTDWIVETFPSRLRYPALAPIWYGERADLAALLVEALPRALALDRLPQTEGAVALVSLRLGRLDRMQEMLEAGVFAPRPVKVHAWDKVISADIAWRLETAPGPREFAAGAARLRAAFAPGVEAHGGPPLALVRGGAPALPAGTAAAVVRAGAEILDPDSTPLRRLIPAIAAAPRLLTGARGELSAALLASPGARAAELPAARRDPRAAIAASRAQIPTEILAPDAAETWLCGEHASSSY